MTFDNNQSLDFSKIALILYDKYKDDIIALQKLFDTGMIMYDTSGAIFEITEYVYERLRVLRNDPKAGLENIRQRTELEAKIQELDPESDIHIITGEDQSNFADAGGLIYEKISEDLPKLESFASMLHMVNQEAVGDSSDLNSLVETVEEQIKKLRETERPHTA